MVIINEAPPFFIPESFIIQLYSIKCTFTTRILSGSHINKTSAEIMVQLLGEYIAQGYLVNKRYTLSYEVPCGTALWNLNYNSKSIFYLLL